MGGMRMDPTTNPYTPGAGAMPAELAGRDEEIQVFQHLLVRMRTGRHDRSQIFRGLRGVGKTVLLNRFKELAAADGWQWAKIEATREGAVSREIAIEIRAMLEELVKIRRLARLARRALGAVHSFSLTWPGGPGIRIETAPLAGTADTGILARDLRALFCELGAVLRKAESGAVFLVDELHLVDKGEYEALVVALHEVSQENLPVAFVGAGLPQLPELSRTVKTYAERLFVFRDLGALDELAAHEALDSPARKQGVSYDRAAARLVLERTQGYPYFIQEYGRACWNFGSRNRVTLEQAKRAALDAQRHLDSSFYRTRLAVASPAEQRFLQVAAALGPGPYRTQDLLDAYGSNAGVLRKRLIDKGLMYAPEQRGLVAFSVPRFDDFVRRHLGPPVE